MLAVPIASADGCECLAEHQRQIGEDSHGLLEWGLLGIGQVGNDGLGRSGLGRKGCGDPIALGAALLAVQNFR